MDWANFNNDDDNRWYNDKGGEDDYGGNYGKGDGDFGGGKDNRSGDDKVKFDILEDGPAAMDLGAGDDVVRVEGDGVRQVRVTFTSADVGNGNPLDGNNGANEDGGLAVRLQSEDGSDGLTGSVSRFDDEGISFESAERGLTFDVRDLGTGAQRGDRFDVVRLGTQGGDNFDEGGSRENYYINAGMGDDSLKGGRGDDFLVGGAGNDTLDGDRGDDSLLGGEGADTYVFSTRPEAGNVDRILSFTVGADTVQLENRAFRGLPEGPLAGDAFASFGNAGEADDRIIYNQATGELYFDADGGGRDDLVLFADTTPLMGSEPALTASDFVIV